MSTNGNATSEPAVKDSAMPRAKKRIFYQPQQPPEPMEPRHIFGAVFRSLLRLSRLGRAGQWVLHNEDLYYPEVDTRPNTRKPDEEVEARGPYFPGNLLRDQGMIWAGKGPAPDFDDDFWHDKLEELVTKIEQVEAGLVQPAFTAEELQTLESLEQQERHSFHAQLNYKNQHMTSIFNNLFELATLGRPGQWILHREDFYHPAVDTRPQTRSAGKGIVIDNFVHADGSVRKGPVMEKAYWRDTKILVDCELIWDGQGRQPNFDDIDFWRKKRYDISHKREEVEKGLVQPQFTPEELQTLEDMEGQEDHIFAVCAREREGKPPVPPVGKWEAIDKSDKLAYRNEIFTPAPSPSNPPNQQNSRKKTRRLARGHGARRPTAGRTRQGKEGRVGSAAGSPSKPRRSARIAALPPRNYR